MDNKQFIAWLSGFFDIAEKSGKPLTLNADQINFIREQMKLIKEPVLFPWTLTPTVTQQPYPAQYPVFQPLPYITPTVTPVTLPDMPKIICGAPSVFPPIPTEDQTNCPTDCPSCHPNVLWYSDDPNARFPTQDETAELLKQMKNGGLPGVTDVTYRGETTGNIDDCRAVSDLTLEKVMGPLPKRPNYPRASKTPGRFDTITEKGKARI